MNSSRRSRSFSERSLGCLFRRSGSTAIPDISKPARLYKPLACSQSSRDAENFEGIKIAGAKLRSVIDNVSTANLFYSGKAFEVDRRFSHCSGLGETMYSQVLDLKRSPLPRSRFGGGGLEFRSRGNPRVKM